LICPVNTLIVAYVFIIYCYDYFDIVFIFIVFFVYVVNELGDDGAKYIVDVLKVNTTLNHIDFWGESHWFLFCFKFFIRFLFFCFFRFKIDNKIGVDGVTQFTTMLKVNTTLCSINLARK